MTRKTRMIDVVYNASNNELVRTKTLVKSCIIQIDATPFRQWYEAHYAVGLGRKKGVKLVRLVTTYICNSHTGQLIPFLWRFCRYISNCSQTLLELEDKLA